MRRIIDIGANLTDGMFQGLYRSKQLHPADLSQVLARAKSVGVERIIVTAGSLKDAEEALELVKTDPMLYTTIGVHPTRCGELEVETEAYLERLVAVWRAAPGKVVAVGELGLDYERLQFCGRETQLKYFEAQFALARATGLPLFLHMRAACDDLLEVLGRQGLGQGQGAVVHSFTGSAEDARRLLAAGLYIGINGCSLKSAENLEVVRGLPLDRLMIETDAPWCEIRATHAGAPHIQSQFESSKKWRAGACVKGRNEPCHVVQVLEVLAALHHRPIQEVADRLYQTTAALFFPNG